MRQHIVKWWRDRRVALTALAVAVIATVGVHVWLDVIPSVQTRAQTITNVAEGESVEIAGQTISLRSARADEFEAPEGMRTVSVRLNAGGGDDATWCREFTLTEMHGERVWLDARSELDVPYDAGEASCRDESFAYEILAVFLVPEDAAGPFYFDIPGEPGEVTRFTVEH
jgi:ferric-dicitrate binding protein FerR (iron transport regulator)